MTGNKVQVMKSEVNGFLIDQISKKKRQIKLSICTNLMVNSIFKRWPGESSGNSIFYYVNHFDPHDKNWSMVFLKKLLYGNVGSDLSFTFLRDNAQVMSCYLNL